MPAHPPLLEITASTACLLNIWLAARANVWNWLFGILTVSLYFLIFLQAKLYADMSLQAVYFVLQFYGLYLWLYGGKEHKPLTVRHASQTIMLTAFTLIILLTIVIALILKTYTDSTTIYIDASTTAISLIAQWMMGKKWIEHWILWMVVDTASIQMYFSKQLYYTAGLYAILFFLCLLGWQRWRQDTKNLHGHFQ